MLELIHVSSRGQIVIPEKVREHLHLKAGSKLVLLEKGGTIILKKEEEVEKHLSEDDRQEEIGWMLLGQKSMEELWDNPKDEEVWKRYL